MRTFKLFRKIDVSNVSGTGYVAEGVIFSNGWVSLRWMTATSSIVFYETIEHVEKIHGHDGNTVIVFD
jgi:hypothetical protein